MSSGPLCFSVPSVRLSACRRCLRPAARRHRPHSDVDRRGGGIDDRRAVDAVGRSRVAAEAGRHPGGFQIALPQLREAVGVVGVDLVLLGGDEDGVSGAGDAREAGEPRDVERLPVDLPVDERASPSLPNLPFVPTSDGVRITSFRLAPVRPRSLCWVTTLGRAVSASRTVVFESGSDCGHAPRGSDQDDPRKSPSTNDTYLLHAGSLTPTYVSPEIPAGT